MPVQVSYPGVYVREISSGVRTITGVSTSVAAFVGMVQRGKLNSPTRVLSFPEYQRKFGTDTTASELTDQVNQFFINGGSEAWITRIANNALPASVQLTNEVGDTVLTVTACEAGPDGNLIRLEVDYDTAQPEQTFNLRAFRVVTNAFGVVQIEADETFSGLSMDPASGNYVETVINQQSDLIRVSVGAGLTPSEGISVAGLLFEADEGAANTTLDGLITPTTNSILISVDGSPLVPVVLPITFTAPSPLQEVAGAINMALTPFSRKVSVSYEPVDLAPTAQYLSIRSINMDDTQKPGGSVTIQPAATSDATVGLQLGVAQGGLEVSGYAALRPAISGFFARLGTGSDSISALLNFAAASDLGTWTLTDSSAVGAYSNAPTFSGGSFYEGSAYDVSLPANPGVGSLINVRENLQIIADSINANAQDLSGQALWDATIQGYRLVLRPRFGDKNSDAAAVLTSDGGYNIGANNELFGQTPTSSANSLSYSMGSTGLGDFQAAGADGTPGGIPSIQDYQDAFEVIDRDVDIFNLLILPRASGQSDQQREALWGIASNFCLNRRVFLLVDPRSSWENVNDVESEIAALRIGIVKDHAAIYWPRVQIPTNEGGLRTIDPSGSIAGVMARIDSNRGVWKAAAGLEADIRGIRALEHLMSDPENGVINPEAVNAIRAFPTGIVSWGARTMDGSNSNANADYRYIPIRRLALFIEESLFRGLKFAVFEPNDEPLWAQIRLAAGAFMNNLFRQGAFQGQKARDAYFVKVDSETTTQNDINLGIVNVVVGFAPLRPAEFVIITLQQIAGQIQV